MRSRWSASVPALVVLGLGLSACGGESATADDASEAVEDFLKELAAGDFADACDRLTDDEQQSVVDEWNETDDEGLETCDDALEASWTLAAMFSEGEAPFERADIVDITAEVDGDTATATVDWKDDDDETYPLTFTDGKWLISSLEDEDEFADEGAADDSGEEGSEGEDEPPAEPSAIGEPVELDDWTVTVTEVERNADQTLAAANLYNQEPDHQYLLVTFEAVYNGDDRTASVDADFTWSLSGNDNSVYETDYQTTPADNESWPSEVRTGGTARGQVVFDLDPAVVDGALLSVESYDDDYDTVYVDFQL